MRINNNMIAMNTHRQLRTANTVGAKSMEKLSSGLRINRAGDDAAGLAISEKMRGQIRGLNQASSNAQDGISMIQTAEGALNETHAILQRMRELAVQSATDTNTADDRAKIQGEVDQLAKEITRISNDTEFNTQNLMAGGLDNTFHVGANQGQNVNLKINAMDAHSLGVGGTQKAARAFAAGMSGITGTSEFGKGLTDQTYKIITTKEPAKNGELTGGTTRVGSLSGNLEGDNNIDLQIKLIGVSSGKVTAFSYSTDGGSNFTAVNASTGAIGTTGVTWTANDGGYSTGGDTNKSISATLFAAKYTAKLVDGGNADVGTAVDFSHSSTSATIGNAATGETMKISFEKGGIVAATDATQVITTVGSASASVDGNGFVTNKAVVSKGVNVSSQGAADKSITTIDKALEKVSSERSKLGAVQNRLEHTIKNLDTSSENLQASEARIRDVDMAKEMMEQTKQNILAQASTAMLANANQAPQAVLQLLR